MLAVLSGFALLSLPHLAHPAAAWILYLFLILTVEAGVVARGRCRQSALLSSVLFCLTVLFLFAAFESLALTLPYFNSHRYDGLMAAADRSLLGVDPTLFLEKFTHPAITEVLYVLYAFYFPMPVILLVWMLRRGRLSAAADGTLRYLVCYYGAYIAYFFIPVRGPRFYLAHLQGEPLTGLLLSEPIRRLIDLLEPNKLDAFPSLHAAILLITLILAFRENRTMFRWFLALGAGIVVSLVYLRYHYLADVLAGLLWGAASWWLGGLAGRKFGPALAAHYGEET
jgi:membrane-associated phospholipid phosphatase